MCTLSSLFCRTEDSSVAFWRAAFSSVRFSSILTRSDSIPSKLLLISFRFVSTSDFSFSLWCSRCFRPSSSVWWFCNCSLTFWRFCFWSSRWFSESWIFCSFWKSCSRCSPNFFSRCVCSSLRLSISVSTTDFSFCRSCCCCWCPLTNSCVFCSLIPAWCQLKLRCCRSRSSECSLISKYFSAFSTCSRSPSSCSASVPSTSFTRSRFCVVSSSLFSAVSRLNLNFTIPAASSIKVRRSTGFALTISPIRPCSMIE